MAQVCRAAGCNMAARFRTKEYSFPSTAAVKLTTVLGLTNQDYVSTLVIRAGASNTGTVYWGGSDVTTSANRGGYLAQGDAVGIDIINKYFGTDEVYFVGAQNDIIHITWVQQYAHLV